MTSIFRMAAAMLALSAAVPAQEFVLRARPEPILDPNIRIGVGHRGSTQGSNRDVDKARRRNRLARKARRQERLHRKH